MKKLILCMAALFYMLGCTKDKVEYLPSVTFNCPMHTDLIVEIASDGNSARMTDNAERVFILNRESADDGMLFKNSDGIFIKINGETAAASLTGRASFECSLFIP